MRLGLGLVLVVTMTGCAGGRRVAGWQETWPSPHVLSQADVSAKDALLDRADAAWSERATEAKARECIASLRQALTIDPTDAELWAFLARANYFLADAHLSFDPSREVETIATYHEGAQAAERGLTEVSPAFAERAALGAQVDEQLSLFDTRAVPFLYWRAQSLHRWSTLQGSSVVRRVGPDVRASMTRVLELDPSFDFGGVYRYFGEYYGRARPSAGGDLARAKANFEASIRTAPQSLAARVQLAEIYATATRNRRLFDEQIHYVLMYAPRGCEDCEDEACEADDVRAENAADQKRARKLLEQANILFR